MPQWRSNYAMTLMNSGDDEASGGWNLHPKLRQASANRLIGHKLVLECARLLHLHVSSDEGLDVSGTGTVEDLERQFLAKLGEVHGSHV